MMANCLISRGEKQQLSVLYTSAPLFLYCICSASMAVGLVRWKLTIVKICGIISSFEYESFFLVYFRHSITFSPNENSWSSVLSQRERISEPIFIYKGSYDTEPYLLSCDIVNKPPLLFYCKSLWMSNWWNREASFNCCAWASIFRYILTT